MTAIAEKQILGEANQYATRHDFSRIFSADVSGLYQLAFLLTRDQEKAQHCFVAGLEDCVKGNRVFREWARSWARRTIIQNAIRELKPRPHPSHPSASATVFPCRGGRPSGPGGHFELEAILGLRDFERFVLVMSVLEHYSEHDCSLLLDCLVSEIREARTHALQELVESVHRVSAANLSFSQETK